MMFELVGTLVAVYVLLAIAFPRFFVPPPRHRKKQVGSSYWGVYQDQSVSEPADAPKIDTPKPARMRHPVAGSGMYAGSNGNR